MKFCKYCGRLLEDDNKPGQIFCNAEHAKLYRESGPLVDPVVDILSRVDIPDTILQELDACSFDQEKYAKYYRASDLTIINIILGQIRQYEPEPDNVNFKAFNNLMKWIMYMVATNPWWHRKLCYYNRMMGVNTNNTSYWHLQYHPAYIPGNHWNESMEQTPKAFNDSQMNQKEIYAWIDKKMEEMDNE